MVVQLASTLLAIPLPYAVVTAIIATLLIRYPFYRKMFFFFISVGLTTMYGAVLCIVLAPIGQRSNINYYSSKFMCTLCSFLTGLRVEIEGAEHLADEQPRVIVANHQATLDVFIMAWLMPRNCVVVAKKSLRYVPLLGTFIVLGRGILIDRKNHESALLALKKAADDIKAHNLSVFAYPEGTRARLADASMLPFKKGAFHMAQQGQVPIVPVVISNYSNIYSGQARYWVDGVVRVKVLPPISTKGMETSDVEALTQNTRNQMLDALKQLSDRKEQ
ncbi:hypothetical protein BDF19DRAFT_444772 [Syncephalis fuscata]|nr:hypothetical protein BDF19DRAFT_444772 [Syncephalis fuscata]